MTQPSMAILEISICNLQVLSSPFLFIPLLLKLLKLLMEKKNFLLLRTTCPVASSTGRAFELNQLMVLARVPMSVKERTGIGVVGEYTERAEGTFGVIHRGINSTSHKAVAGDTLTHSVT